MYQLDYLFLFYLYLNITLHCFDVSTLKEPTRSDCIRDTLPVLALPVT